MSAGTSDRQIEDRREVLLDLIQEYRGELQSAFETIDELRDELNRQSFDIKKLKERLK